MRQNTIEKKLHFFVLFYLANVEKEFSGLTIGVVVSPQGIAPKSAIILGDGS